MSFQVFMLSNADDSQVYSNLLLYCMTFLCYDGRLDGRIWRLHWKGVAKRAKCDKPNDGVKSNRNIPYLKQNIFKCYCRYTIFYFLVLFLGQSWVMFKKLLKIFCFT